jgi:hypothetical protein
MTRGGWHARAGSRRIGDGHTNSEIQLALDLWADNSRMVWFLALWLGAAPQKLPIDSLTVEGLKNYSQAQALAVADSKSANLPARRTLKPRDRLLATGVFKNSRIPVRAVSQFRQHAASFQVVEVQPLSRAHRRLNAR